MTSSTPTTHASAPEERDHRAPVDRAFARRWRPEVFVAVGALVGLVWAASLRGWLVELARPEAQFGWATFAFVLTPGAAVGALLGLAAYRRPHRTRTDWRLALAPALLATALVDPATSRALGSVDRLPGPLRTAHAAWVWLLGLSLLVVLGAGASLAYPARRWPGWQLAALGAVAGLAWAGALRSFMAAVAGPESGVTWVLTFGYILPPGALVGGLLGWAAHLRLRGDDRWRWRLAWSPMLFAAVLFSDPLHFADILRDGLGAGAAAVPLFAILGGYAGCTGGRRWLRAVSGLVFVGSWGVWLSTAESVGGPNLALTTAHGLWASVLHLGLLAVLASAASIPMRAPAATYFGVKGVTNGSPSDPEPTGINRSLR
jgi:hypothetical protein